MRGMGQPDDLRSGASRVEQPCDGMEDVAHAQLLPHLQKPVQRRMVQGDVEVGEALLRHHVGGGLRFQIDRNPQRLQHPGIAGAAGDAVIAVHEDRGPGGGRHDRRPGQRMKRILLARVGRQIDDAELARDRHRCDIGPRRRGERREFGHGFHLDPHRDQKGSRLRRRGLAFDQGLHGPLGFVPGQVLGCLLPFGDFCDEFLHRHQEALWRPHSVLASPCHRPERGSSPGITGFVQWVQPMLG